MVRDERLSRTPPSGTRSGENLVPHEFGGCIADGIGHPQKCETQWNGGGGRGHTCQANIHQMPPPRCASDSESITSEKFARSNFVDWAKPSDCLQLATPRKRGSVSHYSTIIKFISSKALAKGPKRTQHSVAVSERPERAITIVGHFETQRSQRVHQAHVMLSVWTFTDWNRPDRRMGHTHLLRNILSNYWCGMHRTCKKHSSKPDRRWWMTRREKQCRRILPLKL